ncbi:hypothetical protein BS78_01G127700 [Paspalum vaginatum]|nr:hypothetical protein BS78_01G127700 [Paspalum vaginatum]
MLAASEPSNGCRAAGRSADFFWVPFFFQVYSKWFSRRLWNNLRSSLRADVSLLRGLAVWRTTFTCHVRLTENERNLMVMTVTWTLGYNARAVTSMRTPNTYRFGRRLPIDRAYNMGTN